MTTTGLILDIIIFTVGLPLVIAGNSQIKRARDILREASDLRESVRETLDESTAEDQRFPLWFGHKATDNYVDVYALYRNIYGDGTVRKLIRRFPVDGTTDSDRDFAILTARRYIDTLTRKIILN